MTFKDYFNKKIDYLDNVREYDYYTQINKIVVDVFKKRKIKTIDDNEALTLIFELSEEIMEEKGLPMRDLENILMGDLIVKNIKDIEAKTLRDIKNECDYKEGKKVIAFIDTFEEYRNI